MAQAALRGSALVLARAPSARGDVKPGMVARLVHRIWRAFSDGILVLEEGGTDRRLLFLRGAPVAFRSSEPTDSLIGWMAASGRLDEGARATAEEGTASGLSPGAALIAAGVLEHGEPLQAALRAHLEAMVVRTIALREGRWRFHAGAEFAAEVHPVEILPLEVVLTGARAGLSSKHFADVMEGVMDAYPALTGEFPRLLPATGLSPADLRLAIALDGRITTRELLLDRPEDLKQSLSLLWFLSLVDAIAFRDEPAPGPGDREEALPREKKPLPPDRAEALRQAALQILPGSYFHALGLDLGADAREVERAYREVASRFHPDGFAEYDVGDHQDMLAAVQEKVTAAFRVLSDDGKRRAYLSLLVRELELSGARRPGIDVDAEIALEQGVRALVSRRNAEAVSALTTAVELNPREPEYHAMRGFAALFDPVLSIAQRAAAARKSAREALQLEPAHPRATAVLALAEELSGDVAEARRLALDGLEAHPTNEVLKEMLRRLHVG